MRSELRAPAGLSRRRLLGGSIGFLTVAATGAACGDRGKPRTRLAAMRQRGFARLAVANEEPFGYVDAAGNLAGAMPAIAAAVLHPLGVERVEPVSTTFTRLIETVLDGRADLIAAGMSITDSRCAQVTFARPDFYLPQALGVAKGNPLRLRDLSSVAASPQARLGVLTGAVEADYATAAGIPAARILRFDRQEELVTAVLSGDISAYCLTSMSARALVAKAAPGALTVTPAFWPFIAGTRREERSAIAFNPEDTTLVSAYGAKASELRRAGTLGAILRRYGFHPDEIITSDLASGCPM